MNKRAYLEGYFTKQASGIQDMSYENVKAIRADLGMNKKNDADSVLGNTGYLGKPKIRGNEIVPSSYEENAARKMLTTPADKYAQTGEWSSVNDKLEGGPKIRELDEARMASEELTGQDTAFKTRQPERALNYLTPGLANTRSIHNIQDAMTKQQSSSRGPILNRIAQLSKQAGILDRITSDNPTEGLEGKVTPNTPAISKDQVNQALKSRDWYKGLSDKIRPWVSENPTEGKTGLVPGTETKPITAQDVTNEKSRRVASKNANKLLIRGLVGGAGEVARDAIDTTHRYVGGAESTTELPIAHLIGKFPRDAGLTAETKEKGL
jgi:hypothetical protein